MKKIPKILYQDYALLGAGFTLFFLLDPFNLNNAITDPVLPMGKFIQIVGEGVVIFIGAVIAEIITTYLLKLPCDYSKDWNYQIKRKVPLYLLVIIILSCFIGQYFTVIKWGFDKWQYFWQDTDGSFSLKWYMSNFKQDLGLILFIALYWGFLTSSRMNKYKIQQLLSLNDAIERTEETPEEKFNTVLIAGESKESLEISPTEILYIESIANYLSIWYFNDGKLQQKRIRNTLKSVEETLADYPFLLHCHRAFLVNTRFITHVDGNAAGCQVHLFSIDRTIPVSKANIEALRQTLSAS